MKDIEIDWNEVGYLLEAGCSGVQISELLGIHENTLYGRCKDDLSMDFMAFKAKNKSKGDSKLLTAQYEAAIKDKDRGMLVWLGKQRLDQSEKSKVQHEGNPDKPISFVLDDRFNDSKDNSGISA